MAKFAALLSRLTGSMWFSLAAPALLLTRYGAGMTESWTMHAFVALFAAHLLSVLLPDGSSLGRRLAADRWVSLFLALTVAAILLTALFDDSGAASRLVSMSLTVQVGVFAISTRILVQHLGVLLSTHVPVWGILPISFAAIIAAGTGLLKLPSATAGGISVLNAAFTATSAVCVTGLTVVDTGTVFTQFGQAVILALIQVGGLGLMSFFAFFALFMGHSVGLGQSVTITRAVDAEFVSDVKRTIASIIGWTFTIEAVGALLLYTSWRPVLSDSSQTELAWQSVFHSVSAFCNAGFSLFSNNLEGFRDIPSTSLIISGLIVCGGIGFAVLTGVMTALLLTLRGKRHNRLDVHSRLVLLVTAILLASGTVFLLAVEWDGAFAGMNLASRAANALMGSVSPRTAGFNTVPMMSFHPATRWVFMILMFIGASPGGTGGGVKTTTIGLLAVAGVSLVRKRPQPEMWHRMIPLHDLQRASFLIFAALIVCAASAAGLLLAEMPGGGGHSTEEYLFETFSAFGTVGLSTGVTGELTVAGRWIIILTMFAGRVGPSVLAALTIKPRALAYRFPEGRVGIG